MGIFISYSSKEYEEAHRLKTVIENNGIPCWMAPRSIPVGSDYSSEIPTASTAPNSPIMDYASKCNFFLLIAHFIRRREGRSSSFYCSSRPQYDARTANCLLLSAWK